MKISSTLFAALSGVIASVALMAGAPAQTVSDRSKLPTADPPFKGKIGKTYKESRPAWPAVPAPPAGAPQHPEWKKKQPFKALLEGDKKTFAVGGGGHCWRSWPCRTRG